MVDDNTVISRFRRHSATELTLNDNDNPAVFNIGPYFDASGAGNDLTIYFQTTNDGEVSFAASDQFLQGGTNYARFTLPADVQTLLDNLDIGDRWIAKFARASVTEFNGDAETIDVSVSVSDATGTTVAPEFDGDAETITVTVSVSDATGATVPPDAIEFDGDAEPITVSITVSDATGELQSRIMMVMLKLSM